MRTVTAEVRLEHVVTVRPGDTLVIATPSRLNEASADEMKRGVAEKLPGVRAVIVSDCSGLAVYRDDGGGRQPDSMVTVDGELGPDHPLAGRGEVRDIGAIDPELPNEPRGRLP